LEEYLAIAFCAGRDEEAINPATLQAGNQDADAARLSGSTIRDQRQGSPDQRANFKTRIAALSAPSSWASPSAAQKARGCKTPAVRRAEDALSAFDSINSRLQGSEAVRWRSPVTQDGNFRVTAMVPVAEHGASSRIASSGASGIQLGRVCGR